jgi:DNA-binding NarL/FixJ family response regulator
MSRQPTATRVVVVDDHALFRTGVSAELAQHAEVVGEAGDVDTAIAVILATLPDVVVLDVHLPGGDGHAVVAAVLDQRPEIRFLALSVSDEPDDVISLVRAGARGYVTKHISADELVDAVQRVADGDAVFSPRLAGFVLDAFAGHITATADPELDQLTPREQEVMRYLARGYAYKEIAAALHISIKTVETHASSVLRKLQLSSRHELARWASVRRIV